MIVGIISVNNNKYISNIIKKFIKKISNEGHIVKEINSDLEEPRLTGYSYLLFFVGKTKIDDKKVISNLKTFLKNAGMLNNKYASIFLEKKIIGNNKRLLKFSSIIEEAGLMIHFTEIIKDTKQIETILSKYSTIKFGK